MKSKVTYFLLGIIILFSITGCSFKGFFSDSEIKLPAHPFGDSEKEEVIGPPSPFTGLPVKEETLSRRPLAITINNAITARPQSGLNQAEIVYEFLAEGGITRLLAIYQHNEVAEIGPVRSARPYFITQALEYNALYVHCGGSEEALADIKRYQVTNLDEFGIGRRAFWRSSDRVAPHNLYTSTEKLRSYAKDKGMEGQAQFPSFKFLKAAEKNAYGKVAREIKINYPGKSHKVSYTYNEKENSYSRFNSNVPHVDKITNQQLVAQNVLVQFASTITREDTTLVIDLIGQGRALLFNNGEAYEGIWRKDSRNLQTVFISQEGAEFKLVPGQTWVQVVPAKLSVEYN